MWRVQCVHLSKGLHTAHGLLVVWSRSPTKQLHTTHDMDQAAILCDVFSLPEQTLMLSTAAHPSHLLH